MIIIGILVLLITCFNYMNLSTAHFMTRTREVGVRKVFRARKGQLIGHFMVESIMTAFIAHIFAMVLVEIFLPLINRNLDLMLGIDYFDYLLWMIILSLILFTGLLAGTYPALIASSLNPAVILRSGSNPKIKGTNFRMILVVAQFVISISLLLGSLLNNRQLAFLENQDLGLDRNKKLRFQLPEGKVGPDN